MRNAVEGDRRSSRSGFVNSDHVIEFLAKLLPAACAAFTDAGWKHHVADLEIFAVGIPTDGKRRVLRAKEIGPARSRHIRCDHVRRQTFSDAPFVRDDRPE